MKLPWSDTARGFLAVFTVVSLSLVAGCSGDGSASAGASVPSTEAAHATTPASRVTVLSLTDPAELALASSQTFFASAPLVVVADADDAQAQAAAAAAADVIKGPVLLAGGGVSDDELTAELRRLGAQTVVEVSPNPALSPSSAGLPVPALDGLSDVTIVHLDSESLDADSGRINPRDQRELSELLPAATSNQNLSEVLVLLDGSPEQAAAAATARAAGAWPLLVQGGDPRADTATVKAIAAAKALAIVGIGPSFGSADDLEWKVDAAESGDELPGGGQLVFSGKRVVATSGQAVASTQTPRSSPSAGTDVTQMVTDARTAAAAYVESSPEEVVVPALEVSVTTVSSSAGADGDYSQDVPVEVVQPIIDAAAAAGVYVLLRFEPGRATFAEQITAYAGLLTNPGVGVALDVSARRGTTAKQNGTVTADELNSALGTLAAAVRTEALPQMLVVVEQSTPESVTDRESLVIGAGELAVVLDVNASTSASAQSTLWSKNLLGAPAGTHGGWTTVSKDPAKDAKTVEKLTPAPAYVAGAR